MTDNIYAAPLSNLDEQPYVGAEERFYVVSTRKMMVLFFITVGMYQLYWYFKNWILHRHATGERVWPLPRAIFSIFFIHSLLRHIGAHDPSGKRPPWDSGSYAAALVFLQVVGIVLSLVGGDSTFFDVLGLLLIIPSALVLKQVQREVNARCGDPDGAGNDTFTIANWFWCVLGAMFWLLVLVGLAGLAGLEAQR